MKTIFAMTLIVLFATSAFATSDANTRVFIVAQAVQEEGEYFIERVPVIGCYGLAQGPQLAALTQEYKVPDNIGCGGEKFETNINALTCAKVTDSKESDDFNSYSEITLDISKCTDKNNARFITMIRTAVKLNFPQSNKKKVVKLTLIK